MRQPRKFSPCRSSCSDRRRPPGRPRSGRLRGRSYLRRPPRAAGTGYPGRQAFDAVQQAAPGGGRGRRQELGARIALLRSAAPFAPRRGSPPAARRYTPPAIVSGLSPTSASSSPSIPSSSREGELERPRSSCAPGWLEKRAAGALPLQATTASGRSDAAWAEPASPTDPWRRPWVDDCKGRPPFEAKLVDGRIIGRARLRTRADRRRF